MKTGVLNTLGTLLIVVVASIVRPVDAGLIQNVSRRDPAFGPLEGGGGDSELPIVSASGRYVLFASTANNLALTTNGTPVPAVYPAPINVYLRDRTNGTTELVSVNTTGTGGGNDNSFPAAVSANGRFVLFQSDASNLVSDDTNNVSDVFVRDLVNETNLLVSISTGGGVGNGASRDAVMTPDGRYVAFVSAATNLVVGDANRIPDVFVRDLEPGTTLLVSVGATSTNASVLTSSSESPGITPDGRYVVFFSTATNLVPGLRIAGEVFVRDMIGGTTAWASVAARSVFQSLYGSTNAISYNSAISDEGRYVVFETSTNVGVTFNSTGIILRHDMQSGVTDLIHSNANVPMLSYENIHNLDMTPDGRFVAFVANVGTPATNSAIYLWDAQTGTRTPVSVNLGGELPANAFCDSPSVSSDGQYVAFLCDAAGLVANSPVAGFNVYSRDVQVGVTKLLNVDANGAGSGVNPTVVPVISQDGFCVAFETRDGNLVPGDRNRSSDVFVRDTSADTTELISERHPSLPSLTPAGPSGISSFSVNWDGQCIAFTSDSDDVTLNDTNGLQDVFVRDLFTGTNALVSAALNGGPANGISTEPAINANARYVAFTSSATNLVLDDNNNADDVFLRDLETGTTTLVSLSTDGIHSGNGASYSPMLGGDGRFVLFRSKANDIAPGAFTTGSENLFFRDTWSETNGALTVGGVGAAVMTPDARFVAFQGCIASGTQSNLYVLDFQTSAIVYTNTTTSVPPASIGISPDGNFVTFATSLSVTTQYLADRAANTTSVIGSEISGPHPGIRFSADGRFLVYSKPVNNSPLSLRQIYLYDLQTRNTLLLSTSFDSLNVAGGGHSDWPDISFDGRFVVYRSAATNIVAGDNNGFPDLFIYDRLEGTNRLLTQGIRSAATADNRSLRPVFSGNGHTLVFQSWASDLTDNDFNFNGDVYAYALLYADVAGNPPTISWPYVPGQNYRVQYKDDLNDTEWHEIVDVPTIEGNRATLVDPTPLPGMRLYRVVAQ
jgi:WD40-like Beta Propeller Repeat